MKHLQHTANLLMGITMFVGATKGKFRKMHSEAQAGGTDQESCKLKCMRERATNRISVLYAPGAVRQHSVRNTQDELDALLNSQSFNVIYFRASI